MPNIDVRWLGPDDEALANRAMREVLEETGGIAEGWLADDRVHLAVVVAEGAPVGVAYGHTLPLPDGRVEMLLYSLDVLQTHRRRGYGRALVEAFLERTRSLGFDELWVLTGPENEAGNATYRSVGPPSEREVSVMYVWSTQPEARSPGDAEVRSTDTLQAMRGTECRPPTSN